MKYYYHATLMSNLYSILNDGIKRGCDGLVYLTEKPEDAVKFVFIRNQEEPILTIRVRVNKKQEKDIIETFDHSESFFKCRSFASKVDVNSCRLDDYRQWNV